MYSRQTSGRTSALLAFLLATAPLMGCAAGAGSGIGDDSDSEDGGGGPGTTTTTQPPPPACEYPTGTPGVAVGNVVASALSWEGFAENRDTQGVVKIANYLDCDGTKNINALLIDVSATWCGACQEEAAELPAKLASSWTAKGIHVLTLMIEDGASKPATVQTALAWKNQFQLDIAVAADPAAVMLGTGSVSVGLPLQLVVDPRNMTIVERIEGYSPTNPTLEQVAAKNAM